MAVGRGIVGERVSAAPVTGRLAPSPTGRMHLGNAYAALAAWLGARAKGGRVLLRIEDIDAPRVVKDADRWIMDDLAWLGLDWDGEPVYQSQRLDAYEEALRRLREQGLVYPCFCSRADIRAASAPNEGDGFLIYPGTCRRLPAAERESRVARGDRHSWRLAVPDAYAAPDPASCAAPDPDTSVMSEHADSDISRVDRAACDAPTEGLPRVVCFDDRVFGPQRFDLPRQLGDVVVRRSDGLAVDRCGRWPTDGEAAELAGFGGDARAWRRPACRGRLLRVAAAIGGRAAADDAAGAAAVVLLGCGGGGYRRSCVDLLWCLVI